MKPKMKIHFLGTNGWFSTKAGNTVCAAIQSGNRLVVLDAGGGFSGLAPLMSRLGITRADVFLSHLHLDHAAGLHTLPLMKRGMHIRIFVHRGCLPQLRRLVAHPYTASPSEQLAKVTLHPLCTGQNRVPYAVQALPLDHADPCFGFRFSLGGKEISYCTDTGPCKNMLRLARGADALITECTLPPGSGRMERWPHLSPEMAARAAGAAEVSCLLLTHFDAKQEDGLRFRRAAQLAARRIFPRAVAARDGMSIEI